MAGDEPAIVYGPHALEAIFEREIAPEWIERTLRTPEALRPDPKRPGRTLAFRRIPEFGNRWLRVVYEREAGYRVVTAFFDRGMRG